MLTDILLSDSADSLVLIQQVLLETGVPAEEIELATDGYRAVELAERGRPSLVITETAMGELSGAELVRRLRIAAPDARIICWTAAPSADEAARVLGVGARAYLPKADGVYELMRAVRPVMDGGIVLSPAIARELAQRFAAAVSRDLELEGALAEASLRIEEMNHAKAEFLANVSHELRTPITIAKGIAYVLRRGGLPEEEHGEFLGKLEGSLDKLLSLVNGLLTLAELDRGTLTLNVEEVDLGPMVHELCDGIATDYPDVRIERDIAEDLRALADPDRIAVVVRQLLDNACRYSPASEPVTVRARTMEEGVVVGITDRGQGIDRGMIARAFDQPFSAGEEILRKERSGLGVGLHMARRLIREHGGIIWADPLPAGGTRVSFCIPSTTSGEVTERPREDTDVVVPYRAPSSPAGSTGRRTRDDARGGAAEPPDHPARDAASS